MAFLNSLGTSSSSQMLVSEWSASRATGPADLKISAGIPSIPGEFPELVCLIAFETSSIVEGRSKLVFTGFYGIWLSTVGSTVEGLLSRVLKCSLNLALMLFFSLSRVGPSADRNGVVRGYVGPYTALMALKNIFEFFVAAWVSISSAFFSHHSSSILRSAV